MKNIKKIVIALLLIPIAIIIIGLTKHNIELNRYIRQHVIENTKHKNKPNINTTEVHIVGTVHFETDSIKRQNLYNYINSISPSIILYEGDSSTVRRILKKRDYFFQLIRAFKTQKEMEKAIILKYIEYTPNCVVLPYEWELRDKYHRKHKLRKKSKELLSSVIKLYNENQLTEEQSGIIDGFLELNNTYNKIFADGTIADINSLTTDSIIKQRQNYVYKIIPEIVKNIKELSEYLEFVPFHMSYWDKRNKAMTQNILKQIQHNPNKVIVVLTGFSHRYYLVIPS